MGSKKARNKSAASSSSAAPTSGRRFRAGLVTLTALAAVVAAFLLLTAGPKPVQSQEPQPVRREPPASQGASAPVSQSPASPDAPPEGVPPARATPSQAAAPLPSPVAQPSLPPLPPLPPGTAGPVQVVRAVYEFAARHPEVLRYVPCFCGCEQDGHLANEDCFVASRDSEGRVTGWDRHGMT